MMERNDFVSKHVSDKMAVCVQIVRQNRTKVSVVVATTMSNQGTGGREVTSGTSSAEKMITSLRSAIKLASSGDILVPALLPRVITVAAFFEPRSK